MLETERRPNKNDLLLELGSRELHSDPDVARIAKSLSQVAGENNSWITRVSSSELSQNYTPMELTILLEKVAILHLIGNLWEQAANNDPEFESNLENVRAKLKEADWDQITSSITDEEWQKVIGQRFLQTHLSSRYRGVAREVIRPILKEREAPITVVDAGSSAGIGIWGACEEGININSWLAIDSQKLDIPWTLTCSIRLSEILSGTYSDYLKKIKNSPSNLKRIVGDIRSLPIRDNMVDVYLAIFSWYQLGQEDQTLKEAQRIVRPGGLIIITDHVIYQDNQPLYVSPGQEGELTSIVYVKDKDGLIGPFSCVEWNSSDCEEGVVKEGLEIARQTRASILKS